MTRERYLITMKSDVRADFTVHLWADDPGHATRKAKGIWGDDYKVVSTKLDPPKPAEEDQEMESCPA